MSARIFIFFIFFCLGVEVIIHLTIDGNMVTSHARLNVTETMWSRATVMIVTSNAMCLHDMFQRLTIQTGLSTKLIITLAILKTPFPALRFDTVTLDAALFPVTGFARFSACHDRMKLIFALAILQAITRLTSRHTAFPFRAVSLAPTLDFCAIALADTALRHRVGNAAAIHEAIGLLANQHPTHSVSTETPLPAIDRRAILFLVAAIVNGVGCIGCFSYSGCFGFFAAPCARFFAAAQNGFSFDTSSHAISWNNATWSQTWRLFLTPRSHHQKKYHCDT